jgi:Tol biopolymer transport system component
MKQVRRHCGWLCAAVLFLACPAGLHSADEPKDKKEGLPLKPVRKVEFSTDEGTWMSLDVSRDGKIIVFELLGDLYTLPIEGGEAKLLMGGLPFDSQPRYSPDGKWIAFLSDRDGAENVWIAKSDGSEPKQLSKDKQTTFASPWWTPDGQFVVVSRSTNLPFAPFELWMYHVKGGAGVQITKFRAKPDDPRDKWFNAVGAVATPDGKYLYYTHRDKGFNPYNVVFPLSQIVRRDRKTGDEDTITDAPGSAFSPMLSPDGMKLVYGTRQETETGLRIRDLATGEERWLKYPVGRDDQESLYTRDFLPSYAFTPDGKEVVAGYGGKIHRVNIATGETRDVPFSAKVSLDIGPQLHFPWRVEDGPVKARLIQDAGQSPDAKRLAFSTLTHIYTVDLPAGAPKRVTAGEAREFQPAWSPDGKWLAYVTWSEEGGHIWKTRADGGAAPQQLTRAPAFYHDVVWSPDGSRIVALRSPRRERVVRPQEFDPLTPSADLIWIPSAGGDANVILPARGAGRPHFGPESDRVYVYTPGGLISLRYDGTDRRTHLKVVGKVWYQSPETIDGNPADDIHISPDGQWALAKVSTQLYVIAVPHMGGEPPIVNVFTPSVPVKKITDIGADYFNWADSGATVTWALGSSFFRQPLSTISFEEPKPEEKKEASVAPPAKKPLYEEIPVTLEFPRHHPKGTVVLSGARVITMRGDEVIPAADIVVQDNRVAAVGAKGSLDIPQGAKVIDLAGATVVPGFVDLHPHWLEIRRGVLDMQNWNFLANLAYGVTTGRDPQTDTNDMFAYQDLVDIGDMIGLRAYSTGPGVFADTDFQSLDDVKSVVSRYKKYYRTNSLKSYLVGNRRQREWMVESCKELGVMPTTEGGIDAKLDLTHIIDGFAGNEHSFPIVPLYKDVVELMSRSGISYTPTLIVAYGGPWAENYYFETTEVHDDPKVRRFIPHNIVDADTRRRPQWFRTDEQVFPRLAATDAKIVGAGGRVLIGSHGQFQGLGYHWEMWSLASGGLSNMEVLRSATIHGAEAMGLAQDLGSIEPGKLADLVILNKNPLDDIHNTNTVRYVMKDGELFEGDTLKEVWPVEKPLQPLWWWNEKP